MTLPIKTQTPKFWVEQGGGEGKEKEHSHVLSECRVTLRACFLTSTPLEPMFYDGRGQSGDPESELGNR
jgi:hypothetical protein